MMGVNRVTLLGNLGGDPEVKKTAGGQTLTLFSLATSDAWTNKEGQRQEHTEWHRVVVWGKQAETCAKYLSKGQKAYVEGSLRTRSWEDEKSQQKRYTTEIVARQVLFLNSPEKKSYDREAYPRESDIPNSNTNNKEKENIPF